MSIKKLVAAKFFLAAVIISGFMPMYCVAAEKYELLFTKGMQYFNQENYKEALPPFTQAASLNPDAPHILYYLGLTHTKLGNESEAIQAFKRVLLLIPNYPGVHYALGFFS